MARYDDALRVREARARYFESNGFGDGGYDAKWVKLALGPIPFAFPNSAARVRAVRLHDLHHVATGYDTSVLGEAEIGAWEIGSSCRGFVAAWILNLYAMMLGFWIDPRAVYRAFVRGRHTGNLYAGVWDEALLERAWASCASAAAHGAAPVATRADRAAFLGWAARGMGPLAGDVGAAARSARAARARDLSERASRARPCACYSAGNSVRVSLRLGVSERSCTSSKVRT